LIYDLIVHFRLAGTVTGTASYANVILGRYTPRHAIHSFISGRMLRSGKLHLLTGQKSGFSLCRGDLLHRFMSNLAGLTGTWVRLAVQNFTSIATGVGMRPQIIKNFHFLVNSCPVGATPLTCF